MKQKLIILLLLAIALTFSGCAMNPWGDKDPDNRMRKSPCASSINAPCPSLEIQHVG